MYLYLHRYDKTNTEKKIKIGKLGIEQSLGSVPQIRPSADNAKDIPKEE